MANDERSLFASTSQTVGPFFALGLSWLFNDRVADVGAPGTHIAIQGRVLDGDGVGVSDAMVEVWQADPNGKYAHPDDKQEKTLAPGFRGYARVPTQEDGSFRFHTVKPGRTPAPNGGLQAPHIAVAVFMRGLQRHLVTRIYFPDESSNTEDMVMKRVPEARRRTLIAKPMAGKADTLEWSVVLQGADETVFFDY